MREDVLIILNEREPLKLRMAAELEEHLTQRGLSNSRMALGQKLHARIIKRNPKVIVLDYLLGDVATALDIITEIQQDTTETPSRTVIWTDEPSVNVAVQAMKLGADDYILINSPNSLEKVIEAIDLSLQRTEQATKTVRTGKQQQRKYEEAVAQSLAFRETLTHAKAAAQQTSRITLLYGPTGSGRNTVARYINEQRQIESLLTEIDLDIYDHGIQELLKSSLTSFTTASNDIAATAFVDHIEADSGEFCELVQKQFNQIWPNTNSDPLQPMLILGTSSKETVNVWSRILSVPVIEVPALKSRADDFLPLIQRFAHTHSGSSQSVKNILSQKLLSILHSLEWPGNVAQLRACVIDAIATSSAEQDGLFLESALQTISAAELTELSQSEKEFLSRLMAARDRWERFSLIQPFTPEPVQARMALDESMGNYRIAAARLGTTVQQIRLVLTSASKTKLIGGEVR